MNRFVPLAFAMSGALLSLYASTDTLTEVRMALGGDALSRVTSIRATGKISRPGVRSDGSVEISFQAPDRFLHVTRVAQIIGASQYEGRVSDKRRLADRDPSGGALAMPDLTTDETITTTRIGFRGETMLRSDHGVSAYESMLGGQREYARFAIPLLASLTPSYRAVVTARAGAVDFAGEDGTTWSLAVDPLTHLPASLSWTQATNNQAGASWVMTFDDFRKVGAFTWPHHMTTRLSGAVVEELHIKKYDVNGRIDAKVFR
jgi:hypothetical protein